MKIIARLSLALMMFSLFSILYLVTSVSAQNGTYPKKGMPPMGAPGAGGTKAMPGMNTP